MITAFTMSYDASVKCKKQDVKGLIHHNAREVDMQNDINLNHWNGWSISKTRVNKEKLDIH